MEVPDRDYNIVDNEGHEHPRNTSNKSPNCLQPSSSSSAAAANAATDTEEREYMFEKVVTPSDVGKLNRLVIPKQHAERYFPLDPASNDKGGLLLSFEEDRTGRPWRFRYSYWNSSQSYVMTKGWSRFVKDKRLDAGDTVAFSRAVATGRLFIDWRRRPDPPLLLRSTVVPTWGWGGLFAPHPPPLLHQTSSSTTLTSTNNNNDAATAAAAAMYFRSMGPTLPPPQLRMDGILDSVPVTVSCSAEPKRVRLFGVNLDCTEHDRADPYLHPPSPLQWRLSPVPSPVRSELPQLPSPSPMDQDGARGQKEGSF